MVEYEYLEFLDYDQDISRDSFFPEWIKTDKLVFRRLKEENISPEELKKVREDNPEFYKYFPSDEGDKYASNYDSVLEWYTYSDKLWSERTDACYVMRDADMNFIGMCYLEDVELDKYRGKLGIWIDGDHRGQGYSQHRAEALLSIAFDHLGLDLVEVEIVPDNIASVKSVIKYMKKLGGNFDGRMKNTTKIPSGSVEDLYIWSITQEEFNDPETDYSMVDHP